MRPETLLELMRSAAPTFLDQLGPDLRRFACWCARDAGGERAGAGAERSIETAQRYAGGELSGEWLQTARNALAGFAVGAGAVGLPHRRPAAAVQLAALRTLDEDPFQAATWASHYAVLAALWRDGEGAGVVTRQRHASALRFFVPNPFAPDLSHASVA